ncbi:hypothetical protein ACFY8W_25950 [Streptomyces sp. NPDC012637]|uniref:hypothetical protein n=1 Tax=Streptomyces sp. NPDC012637 TaxID=3364842 RepID=UPI0036EA8B22
MAVFELLDVTLVSDEFDRLALPLDPDPDREPVDLPEGAVVSVSLSFRVGEELRGLTFEEERGRYGVVVAATRHVLGGFRAGGPYELQLPAVRMPVGRANCGAYVATGRFTDAEGRELARESHTFRIVHRPPGETPAPHHRHRRSVTAASHA